MNVTTIPIYSVKQENCSHLFKPVSTEVLDWGSDRLWSLKVESEASLVIDSIFHAIITGTNPPYIYRFVKPGIMALSKAGTLGISLPKNNLKSFLSQENLRLISTIVQSIIGSKSSEEIEEIGNEAKLRSLGCELKLPNGTIAHFGMHPQRMTNLQKAIDHFDKHSIEFWSQTDSQNIKLLLETQNMIFDGVTDEEMLGLRRENTFYFQEVEKGSGLPSFGILPNQVKEKGGSEADVETMLDLVKSNRVAAVNTYTPEEARVMRLVVFIPALVNKIIPSLKDFVDELKVKKTQENVDFVELAAFAHEKITSISPFKKGNGRLARILMNSILIQGGHSPVFFPNIEEYRAQARFGDSHPGSFRKYLELCIGRTQSLHDELNLL